MKDHENTHNICSELDVSASCLNNKSSVETEHKEAYKESNGRTSSASRASFSDKPSCINLSRFPSIACAGFLEYTRLLNVEEYYKVGGEQREAMRRAGWWVKMS